MIRTLLLYDGRMSSAERIADNLCYLIGNAMVSEITEAPEDLSPYDGFCFVFNFYGAVSAGRTRAYLAKNRDALEGRRIIMVGIGFSDLGYTKYVSDSEQMTGISSISGIFISSESETIRIGYEISRILHEPVREVEEHKLTEKIETFIRQHRSLALATAAAGYLRCTPLEYMYLDHVFYVITEGGFKFRGILENGDASAVIYDERTDVSDRFVSLQILCKAAPVPVGSDEYYTAMAAGGMTREKLGAMPITLFLLKIVPLRYEYLDSDLMREGYDIKQILDTEYRRKTWEAGAAYASSEEAMEAAKASEKLKEEAAQAENGPFRIPDVPETEDKPEEVLREAALGKAEADIREDAGIVVKEIFTDVEEEEDSLPDETAEGEEIPGDPETEATGKADDGDSPEEDDEQAEPAEGYPEYTEEPDDPGDYEESPEESGETDGQLPEAETVRNEEEDLPGTEEIWNEAKGFIRSPEIDTEHLPQIDMTVLREMRDEDDEGTEGVYSIREEEEEEEPRFGLAELEAMEEQEEEKSVSRRRKKQRRKTAEEELSEDDDFSDDDPAETDEDGKEDLKPRKAALERRQRKKDRPGFFSRLAGGIVSLLKIEDNEDDIASSPEEETAEEEADAEAEYPEETEEE